MLGLFLFFGFCTFFILFILFKGHIIVHEGEIVVLERFGKFSRTLTPGFHFVTPYVESPKHVYWERLIEQKDDQNERQLFRDVFKGYRIKTSNLSFDLPPVPCYTKERVEIEVNIVLYYEIGDVQKAVYKTQNLYDEIGNKTESLLVGIVNELSINDINTISLNKEMSAIIQKQNTFKEELGLKIKELLIQNVTIPRELATSTIESVVITRKLDSEKMALKSKEENEISQMKMEANIAEMKRKMALAEEEHKIALLKVTSDYELEMKKKLLESEKASMELRLEEQQRLLKLMKESGFTESYFTEKERLLQLKALMESSIEGKGDNRTVIIPYEAMMGTNGSHFVTKKLHQKSQVLDVNL